MTTLKRYPLVQQAAEHLLAKISAGEWTVGQKIPGETTLASTLGVGRSTVREAIRELSGSGILEPRQGSGVYVIATEPNAGWDGVLLHTSIRDVIETRLAIEPEATRFAALRRTEDDLTLINKRLEERKQATTQSITPAEITRLVDVDIAFHREVVGASHNLVMIDLFSALTPRIRESMTGMLSTQRPSGVTEPSSPTDHDAHNDIANAIADREPTTAYNLSRAHLLELLDGHSRYQESSSR